MPGTNHSVSATAEWTADRWEQARAHAQEFLDRPESDRGPWVVGPALVAYFTRGRDRARAREAQA